MTDVREVTEFSLKIIILQFLEMVLKIQNQNFLSHLRSQMRNRSLSVVQNR